MEFKPLDQGVVFTVPVGGTMQLGRQPQFRLVSPRISRHHVGIQCTQPPSGAVAVQVMAHKKVYIEHITQQGLREVQQLQPGQQHQLVPGDILYLLKEGNTLSAGFTLSPTTNTYRTAAAGTSSNLYRPQKRAKTFKPAPLASPPIAHQAAAVSAVGAGAAPANPQLFAGVELVVWDKQHTNQAVALAVQAGAEVMPHVDDHTTHVIASYDTSIGEVKHHLQAAAETIRQQHAQQAHVVAAAAGGTATADAHARDEIRVARVVRQLHFSGKTTASHPADSQLNVLPSGIHFVTMKWLTDSMAAGKMLHEAPYYIHLHQYQSLLGATRQQQQQQDRIKHLLERQHSWQQLHHLLDMDTLSPNEQLPAGMVLAQHQAQAAAAVESSADVTCIPRSKLITGVLRRLDSEDQQPLGVLPSQLLKSSQKSPGQLSSSDAVIGGSTGDELTLRLSDSLEDPALVTEGANKASVPHSNTAPGVLQRHDANVACQQQGASMVHVAGAVPQQQQQQQQYIAPGPDQVLFPGEEWGMGGKWIEPWNDAEAQDTVERLLAHWHRFQYKRRQLAAAGYQAATIGGRHGASDSDLSEVHSLPSSSFKPGPPAGRGSNGDKQVAAAAAPVNTVCDHVACCKQPFCFVAELERVKANYSKGKRDEFRIRAVQRAIQVLGRSDTPLITKEEIDSLKLGAKTTDKLHEILQTGRLWRNQVLQTSDRNKVLAVLQEVWGVAENTAERWYHAGVRTLADVKTKIPNLSKAQEVGLKYFDDFRQCIPREEVAECERLVYDAVAQALQDLTGKPPAEVTHLLHVRCMGSYVRGKEDCGDIDYIIATGPAGVRMGLGPLAVATLTILARQGYITQDMLPLEPHKAMRGPGGHLTWMGVWRGPSSPYYRRIDMKFYPRSQLALAVNYFSSGQDFCRALRYWGNTPVPEIAAAAATLNPAGNAFRLGDQEMVVIHRVYVGKKRRREGGNPSTGAAVAGGGAATLAADLDSDHSAVASDDSGYPAVQTSSTHRTGDSSMGGGGKSKTRETIVGPAIKCTCETDIFKALGLAYVPPHMRNILS